MENQNSVTYAEAGVDIVEGARAVDAIKDTVHSTYRPEVVGDIGGFGGLFSIAAAKDMAQLNNRWVGDDAEAWLDHYDIFCSAGFEPGEEDVWLMERVQASAKEEEKDE